MRYILTGALLLALAGSALANAAEPNPAMRPYHAPHNYVGQPSLDGVWSFNSLTRLERPRDIPNLVMTEAEAKTRVPANILPNDSVGTADTEAYDSFNLGWARLGDEVRSSWLIEPANGRLPYSPAGEAKLNMRGNNNNPEGRSTYERCLTMPQNGPPMFNAAYNNNVQIMQTRDYVVIRQEANHEVRTISLTSRIHAPAAVTRWTGDSVGWYEGETLVVETSNFAAAQSDRRSAMTRLYMSPGAKVIERFTRISPKQIKYEFAVEDPSVFTQVWKGEIPFSLTTEPTFEYACHEGNYGLANILSGARYEEEQKAKASLPSR